MRSFGRILLVGLAFAISHAAVAGEYRTWKTTKGDKLEAELIGQTDTMLKLRGKDGGMALWSKDKLSDEDRAFLGLGERKAPAPRPTSTGAPVPVSLPPQSLSNYQGPLGRALQDKLVDFNGTRFVPARIERTYGIKYYALYFSAYWCPPCRKFTPKFVEVYNQLKPHHPEFEVVYVSDDRSIQEMAAYMKNHKIPWTAVQYADRKNVAALRPYDQPGIPNLVLVDANGTVLSSSYENGEYVGPNKVLADIQRLLR